MARIRRATHVTETAGVQQMAVPKCRKAGFVRLEHVIAGSQSMEAYFCGVCQYEWQVPPPSVAPRSPREGQLRPKRR